jgi:hypothetical protein
MALRFPARDRSGAFVSPSRKACSFLLRAATFTCSLQMTMGVFANKIGVGDAFAIKRPDLQLLCGRSSGELVFIGTESSAASDRQQPDLTVAGRTR